MLSSPLLGRATLGAPSLHHQGMSEGIIECSTMVIPVVTALGIFLESAVVQMPRLDYSFQPENILHRVLH